LTEEFAASEVKSLDSTVAKIADQYVIAELVEFGRVNRARTYLRWKFGSRVISPPRNAETYCLEVKSLPRARER